MHPIEKIEHRLNASSSGLWENYRSHREEVTRQLCHLGAMQTEAASQDKLSLCLLGGGNLNDVDLEALCDAYGDIHLVDLDRAAVTTGLQRQIGNLSCDQRSFPIRIIVHAPVDVTGIAPLLPTSSEKFTSDQDKELLAKEVVQGLASFELLPLLKKCSENFAIDESVQEMPIQNGPFDVVASLCLVSQLIRQIHDAFEKNSLIASSLTQTICHSHLRVMTELIKPGGYGLLVTDLAGTSTGSKELAKIDNEQDLLAYVRKIIKSGQHFPFLDPDSVCSALNGFGQIGKIRVTPTWSWNLGEEKRYLCYAVQCQKLQSSCASPQDDAMARLQARMQSFMQKTGLNIRQSKQ